MKLLTSIAPMDLLGRIVILASRDRLGSDVNNFEEDIEFPPWAPPIWLIERLDSGTIFDAEQTRQLARKHNLNPSRLQRELARNADIVIGDQNLLTNPDSSYIPQESPRPIVLLADEAHGLPDRQRDRDEVHLTLSDLRTIYREMERQDDAAGAGAIEELGLRLRELLERGSGEDDPPQREPFDPRSETLPALVERAAAHTSACIAASKSPEVMREITGKLNRLISPPKGGFDYLDRSSGGWRHEQLDVAQRLSQLWKRCDSVVLFSGTLSPTEHFRAELGLPPENTDTQVLPDLSDRHSRLVLRHAGISTTYNQREGTSLRLAELLANMARITGGRWIVFFPSRAYLDLLEPLLKHHGVSAVALRAGMPPRLLDRMLEDQKGPVAVLALMGGTAGEGIDLPGEDYDGCAIISPAVPPPTPRSELLAGLYEARGFDGRLLASVLPGLIRVRQAAGRLWRGPYSRGSLVLIGRRFGDPDLESILPQGWQYNEPLIEDSDLLDALERWATH
jgi:Rad3-related DNA helicase